MTSFLDLYVFKGDSYNAHDNAHNPLLSAVMKCDAALINNGVLIKCNLFQNLNL